MSSIAAGYQFKPSGHAEPVPVRRYHDPAGKPDKRLKAAFEAWLKDLPERDDNGGLIDSQFHYTRALDLTKGLKPTLEEAHSLLLHYYHPEIRQAGIFISALYEKMDEQEIIFDLELDEPPSFIGMDLGCDSDFGYRKRVLVNYGKAGDFFGMGSIVPVINYGTSGRYTGYFANSPVVNYGDADDHLGFNSYYLVVNCGNCNGYLQGIHSINFGKTGFIQNPGSLPFYINFGEAWMSGPFVRVHDRQNKSLLFEEKDFEKIPELRLYLEGLRDRFEQGRNDYRIALAVLNEAAPFRGQVCNDIHDILKRAGYNV